MPWFQKLCRETGLMIHHIAKPVANKQEVNRTVEEQKLDDKTTLRRTTIDEIEVTRETPKQR